MTEMTQFFDVLLPFGVLATLVVIPLAFWLMCFMLPISVSGVLSKASVCLPLFFLCFYSLFRFAISYNITQLVVSPFLLALLFVGGAFFIALAVKFLIKKSYFFSACITVLNTLLICLAIPFLFSLVLVAEDVICWAISIMLAQWLIILGGIGFMYCYSRLSLSNKFKTMIKWSSVTFILLMTLQLGDLLFGERLHWQTLSQYFSNKVQLSFDEDTSKVKKANNIKAGLIYLNEKVMPDLASALGQAEAYDIIRLTSGNYQQAGVLTANNVQIIAEPGAVVFGKAVAGKGALLIKGDNTYIEGLECHSIYVPDNNGVCIRLEGKGITLTNVYFHHAQGGLLGSPKGGDIHIHNSRFEHLGDGAFYHGIYTLEKTRLFIDESYFLNTRHGGHEIKSRSSYTKITNSVVASNQSRDSRLIDVPNGGTLIIKNNILIEGPFSENHDLLSWGVEGVIHQTKEVIISGNLLISDKRNAKLISFKQQPTDVTINNNVVVGNISGVPSDSNLFFDDRASLSLPSAPAIPSRKSVEP